MIDFASDVVQRTREWTPSQVTLTGSRVPDALRLSLIHQYMLDHIIRLDFKSETD
jgi:hypothetical protein